MARSSGWLAPAVLAAWTIASGAAQGGQTPAVPRVSRPQPAAVTVLQGARVTQTPDGIVIALDASGPLPAPSVGTAQNPPRIYIDLPGVQPAARLMSAKGTGVVRGIRAAINSPQPLVTRVVIDLQMELPYQVDLDRIDQGRMSVTVESSTEFDRPRPEAIGTPGSRHGVTPVETSGSTPPPIPLPGPVVPSPSATAAHPPAPRAATPDAPTAPPAASGSTPTPLASSASAPASAPISPLTTPAPIDAPIAPLPSPPGALPPPSSSASSSVSSSSPTSPITAPAPTDTPMGFPTSSAPQSPKPAPSGAAPTGSPPLSLTEDARKYLAAAAGPLRRLHDLLPLLEAIDRRSVVPIESLEITEKDLRDIRGELLAVQPPRSVKTTHEMIFRGCSLALQAVTARLEAARHDNTAGDWNTASAAAGALMLIERGRAALGQPAK